MDNMEEKTNVLPYGRGSLLLANGNLEDPNFKRTVVLLCEHNAQGSYGLVLNRPLKVTLAEAFSDNLLLKKDRTALHYGGPCDTTRVQWLHNGADRVPGSYVVSDGVALGGDFESVVRMKKEEPGVFLSCFYLGYSGWGEGQLAKEMEEKSWVIAPAKPEHVFTERYKELWQDILKGMGDYYAFLAKMPFDPSIN
ncbi:MAG: YqgE/AlgH family protein [Fibrobacterota bacterium]